MAEITQLPQVAQANTAILPKDNSVLDNYFTAQEFQFRKKQQAYKEKKDAIDQALDTIDFNVAGTWDRDLPYVNQYFPKMMDYANEHPEALNPSATLADLQKHNEFKQISNEGKYYATKSKADKVQYDLWKSNIVKDPTLRKHATDYLKELDDWAALPVNERGDFTLTPRIDYNAIEHVDSLADKKVFGEPSDTLGKPTSSGIAGVVKVPKTKQYNPAAIKQGLEIAWDDPNVKEHYTEAWSADPATQQKFPTPKEYYLSVESELAKQRGYSTSEDLQMVHDDKPSGSGTKVTSDQISERKNLIYKIQNKDAGALDILRGLKYGGLPPLSVEYEKTGVKDSPTTILVKTQPNQYGESKEVRLEVSDKTGGGFLAINQLLNDLEGQTKISVEDLNKIADVKATTTKESNVLKPQNGKIDTSKLVNGEEYVLDGVAYIWDGKNLNEK